MGEARMTTIIYYFTGTGNSLQIARQIGKRLGNCQIESMAKEPPSRPVGGPEEGIGFVFPVYFAGTPRIVKQFVEKLDVDKETYCFALASYGGLNFDALGQLDEVLRQKGARLAYGELIKSPGNNLIHYGSQTYERIHNIIETANIDIARIAEAVEKKEVRPIKRLGIRISKWASNRNYDKTAQFVEKFSVTENCTSCSLCTKVCPVQNITLKDQKPAWHDHCEQCLACIQWCPREAIQHGQKTVNRKRYHNPYVTVKDIAEGNSTTTNI